MFGRGELGFIRSLEPRSVVTVLENQEEIDLDAEHLPEFEFVRNDISDERALVENLLQRGPYDVILLMDRVGFLKDIQGFLESLHPLCTDDTRVVSMYYSYAWGPAFWIAEKIGLKRKSKKANWLKMSDVENLFHLSGYDVVRKEWRVLSPFALLGVGELVNRYFATLPVVRKACARHFLIARKRPVTFRSEQSVSIIIPCRNEKGNIESAVKRIPEIGSKTELIFVEGMSADGTWEEIIRVKKQFPERFIECAKQKGKGKGDAVRLGFSMATGDILMILDADLTVPPEDLPKFYALIASGGGEFINGTRLVYNRENNSMRFLNLIANHLFAAIFSFLLNQRITDTLCGTKVISKANYKKIASKRSYFGEFDPFGDFDLIFGATKLNLKLVEIPIRYANRRYGETQISRFRHGLLLLRMVWFAYRKLKAV